MPSTAAILLSRQPRYPFKTIEWVKQTVRAVEWIQMYEHTLISSIGLQTWELITALGSEYKLPMTLIVPCKDHDDLSRLSERIVEQFELDSQNVQFIAATSPGANRSKADLLRARDCSVIHHAEWLIPVAIRSGGGMETLINSRGAHQNLVGDFRCVKRSAHIRGGCLLDPAGVTPECTHVASGFLIHWTRTCAGPWPGERAIDYYRAILQSPRYPRTALDTLRRIGATRQIWASPRHMPGNTPTVALSGLSPRDAVPLMRWRARYGQMSYEPYGIGIRRAAAERLGVVPVHYYDNSASSRPQHIETWQTQSRGKITDWRTEDEFRYLGSLDLTDIEPNDLRLFCRYPSEVDALESATGIDTIALFAD